MPLSTIRHHFEINIEVDENELETAGRVMVLQLSSLVWSGIEIAYDDYPWKLVRGADVSRPLAVRSAVLRGVVDENACCLDRSFALQLKDLFRSQGFDQVKIPLVQVLRALRRHGKVTNMILENLLNLIKASVGIARRIGLADTLIVVTMRMILFAKCVRVAPRSPTALRLSCAGLLSQLMRKHVDMGHLDSRGELATRTLVALGVPISANKRRRG